jgi:lauroyl/myristoyl acyltransferase
LPNAREAAFRATRSVGGLLPLPALAALLYPFALTRALYETMSRRGRRPPRSLPPGSRAASRTADVRARTSAWMSTASLLWADSFSRAPWRDRIDVADLDELRQLASTRPVIIASLHFGGIFVMPSVLRANGIPTAAVIGDRLWPVRWWRERRAQLTQIERLPAHLRSGDARAVVRYLEPGRCLLVALDYPIGDKMTVAYEGAAMHLWTPSFKLARVTNAAIVPVLVRADGLWRYSVHVGRAVPDELLQATDDSAVLRHLVNELLPIAAARPDQALPLLVSAFDTAVGV